MAQLNTSQSFLANLKLINAEDLVYVERDLCFREIVSMGFLLFGEDRTNAEFILQKLLVLATNTLNNSVRNVDILGKYVSINPINWRSCIIESLAIIGARRVLRKLGFEWQELREFYLPHITEFSINIHPMLKALYNICERLTRAEAGELALEINEQYKCPEEHFRFYDFAFLELFFLNWLTRRIVNIGDRNMADVNVQIFINYFKLRDMDTMKAILLDTIKHNSEEIDGSFQQQEINGVKKNSIVFNELKEASEKCTLQEDSFNLAQEKKQSEVLVNEEQVVASQESISNSEPPTIRLCSLKIDDCYTVKYDRAGILLIINQRDFYQEENEDFKHLLPRKPFSKRRGTDVDKIKLGNVFSSFGYNVVEYDNLSHIQILHHVREAVKRSLIYDSLIVCVLSHGSAGAVYGSNSIPVNISDIQDVITADTLQGKPKMLIIQACQKEESPKCLLEKKNSQTTSQTAIVKTDMITTKSTVPGYDSIRHTETGSWFIQSLCDAVDRLGDEKHMLDIMVAVKKDVTEKRGDKNEVMVPETNYTLGKYFFLPKRQR